MIGKNRAVFVDRDGTLNEMVYDDEHGVLDSPFSPDKFRLKPDASFFIRKLNEVGFKVFVITNQPGVAKGTLTEKSLLLIHEKLQNGLANDKAKIDGIYYCPHHPNGSSMRSSYIKSCDCRKPLPGLINMAAKENNVELSGSYMIGDGLTDIEAGKRAGCKTVLVTNLKLNLLETIFKKQVIPDILVQSLTEALDDIFSGEIIHPFPYKLKN